MRRRGIFRSRAACFFQFTDSIGQRTGREKIL